MSNRSLAKGSWRLKYVRENESGMVTGRGRGGHAEEEEEGKREWSVALRNMISDKSFPMPWP